MFLIQFHPIDEFGRVLGFDLQFAIDVLLMWFNLAIIILILSWLLYKPIAKFMNDRKERIRNDIENAEKSLAEAQAAKASYTEKLAGIKGEREEILDTARKAAGEREAAIIAEANNEAGLIMERARKEIEQEREKAKDEIRSQIIQVSAMMAEQFMGGNMDAATRERILDQSITELGDAPWKN